MKPKNYPLFKNFTAFAKTVIIALIFFTSINRTVLAQGCPATVALTPIETSCGVTSVDLINSVNAYLTGLNVNLNLVTIKVYTDQALTHQLASTVVTESGTYYIKVALPPLVPCLASLSISVNVKKNPTANESHTAILCNGGSSTVTITGTGGVGPYTGDGTYNQTTADGSKTYTITDQNGCTGDVTVGTISQPTAISASLDPATSTALCYGASTAITVSASGGTPGYTYSLNGGAYQGGTSYTEAAGDYTVTVKDANGCTQNTNTVSLTQPASDVSFTSVAQQTNCNINDVTVTANGGYGGAYTYSINNNSYQSSNVFPGITPGTDAINVKDSHGCIASGSITVNQNDLAAVLASATGSDSVCYGYNRRILTAATGGVFPYQYSIDGGSIYQSDSSFIRPAGTYTTTVKDAVGCIASSQPLTLKQPAAQLLFTTTYKMVSCNKATVTITPRNGWGGYSYSFDGSAFGSQNVFTNVGPSVDTVKVIDKGGCIAKNVLTISPSALTASLASSSNDTLSCFGDTRVLIAAAKSGKGPYTYSIGGAFQTGKSFTRPAGTYTVTVKDSLGCVAVSDPLTIYQPASALSLNASSLMTSCDLSTITVTAANGWGGYSYNLNNGSYQGNNTFSNIGPGLDSVGVKDAQGCVTKIALAIQPNNLAATLAAAGNIDSVQCVGYQRTIIAAATGGIAPYSYSINGGSYQAGHNFLQNAGTYTATVKDKVGCTAVSNTLVVRQPSAKLSLTADKATVTCNNSNVTVNAAGGWGGYTYNINNGSYQAGNVFSNVAPGRDSMYVKDNAGCVARVFITIQPSNLSASLSTAGNVDSVSCFGQSRTLITTASGGAAPYTYSIDGNNFQADNNFAQTAGTYTVVVKDAVGCTSSSNTFTLRQPGSALGFTKSDNVVSCNSVNVSVNAAGGWSGYSYRLNNGAYQASSTFAGLAYGLDSISVKDNSGCIVTTTVTVGPAALTASLKTAANIDSVQCYGFSRTISTFAKGGISPYSYSLNGGAYQSSQSFVQGAGTYNVTVMDAVGCIITSNALTVTQPASALALTTSTQNVSCNNSTITVNATGGYGGYTYSIDSVNYQGSNMFAGLPAGTYKLFAMDNAGCTKARVAIINAPANPCSGFAVSTQNGSSLTGNTLGSGKTGYKAETIADVKAYPNPSASYFNVYVNDRTGTQPVVVRVLNMNGKVVYEAKGPASKTFTFGQDFTSGVYIVEVMNGNSARSIKIVKGR